jgi:hypothetical protein
MQLKKRFVLNAFLILPLTAVAESSHHLSLIQRFESEIYTESQPIKPFTTDFDFPISSGNSAFTHNRFELGLQYDAWEVGVQSRYDYLLSFVPDTALYTYLDKNNLPYDDRDYRYFLKAKNITSNGIYASYEYSITPHFTLIPKIAIFASTHYQDGVVDGSITPENGQGDLQVAYYFSNDLLFKSFNLTENPSGVGYSFDLFAKWQITPNIEVLVDVVDLVHRTEFTHSAFAVGQTVRKPFEKNSNDDIVTRPTISIQTALNGNETDHTLTLPVRYKFQANYQFSENWRAGIELKKYAEDSFTALNITWLGLRNWSVSSSYQTKTKAWSVGVQHKYFSLMLQTDNTDLQSAYYAHINWTFNYEF